MSATVFIAYCTGNIAGSQVLRQSDAPLYRKGTAVTAILLGLQILVIIAWRIYLVRENRRRAREIERMGISEQEAEKRGQVLGVQDVTDRKNIFFQ